MKRRTFIAGVAGAVVWLLIAGASGDSVQAEEWPGRLITMVVPYAAGGPVDTVGRIMASGLSEKLRQQVVVENVSGAGGMTGSSRVAKATPDGYTLLLGGLAVLGLVPNLYKKPLYNPVTDFTPVQQAARPRIKSALGTGA
jgi:tripartite-type tricarboxylate transporter receptor subunit TctC